MIVEVDVLAAAACHVILLGCLKRGYAPPFPSRYVGPLAMAPKRKSSTHKPGKLRESGSYAAGSRDRDGEARRRASY